MATLSSLIVKLKLDAGDYKSQLQDAEKSTRGFGSAVGNLQTVGKVALGAGVAGLAAGVAGVGAVISNTLPMAADFQSQVSILGIAAKESGLSFDQLHDAALQVGGDSRLVGVSATGAADAMTGLFKAGLTTTEVFGDLQGFMAGTTELGGALRGAIDLAAATELDMVQASDLAATALATFGGEMETETERAEFINKALNNMVQAADASVADVTDLAMALKNVGPAAAGLGVPIEDVNNALAIMSTRGITGAEAGTQLKSMLTNLQRPTEKVQSTLHDLGVSLFDAEGAFVGMPNLIGQLQDSFSGLTDEQRNLAAQTIAGTFGLNALNTLVDEGVEGWEAMTDATAGAAGIQEQASAMANTFAGRMEALDGVIETLKISIGEAFLPIAQQLVEWLTEVVETHGPAIVSAVKNIVAVVVEVAGAFLEFVQGLASGEDPIGDFANLFWRLASIFGATEEQAKNLFMQVRQIGDKIMEVIGPVVAWVQENVKLQDVLVALGVAIASVIIPALISIASTVAPVIAIFLAVVAVVAVVRKAWEENWGGIQEKLTEIWDGKIKPTLGLLSQWLQINVPIALETLRKFWVNKAWPAIQRAIEIVWPIVEAIFNFYWDWYTIHLPKALKILHDFWVNKAWPAIQKVVEIVWPVVERIFNAIKDFIIDKLIPTIRNLYEKWTTVWWPTIQTVLQNVWTIISTIFEELGRWINDNIVPWLEFLHQKWVEEVWPAIQTAVETAWSIILPIFEKLKEWAEIILPPVLEGLQTVFETIMSGISLAIQPVKDLWDKLVSAVKSFWNWITSHTFSFKFSIPDLPDWVTKTNSPQLELHTAWRNFAREMNQMVIRPNFDLSGMDGQRGTISDRKTVNIYVADKRQLLDALTEFGVITQARARTIS